MSNTNDLESREPAACPGPLEPLVGPFSDRLQFAVIFGNPPEVFCGISEPYFYQQSGQEGEQLLIQFGFCPRCIGSGTAWTECCNGSGGCECRGQAVSFSCAACHGTGRIDESYKSRGNIEAISSVAEVNGGYLFPRV